MSRSIFFASSIALLILTGCRSITPTTPSQALVYSTNTPISSPTSRPEETAPPTAVLVADEEIDEVIQTISQELPSPAPDPLRFIFPTPGPAPVSAWRPPLYPTPWAPTQYDHFFFSRPIAADEVNWPLADYRYGGIFLPGIVHTGIDIPVGRGTPVLAAGPGRVTWAGYGLYRGALDPTDPYGLAVTIRHDFGYQGETLYTVYGHLDQVDVLLGQRVEAGEVLGLSGATGQVTGPHLHFEVRIGKNNYFVSRNPELWLAPPQGWGILAARITNSNGNLIRGMTVTVISQTTGQTWYVKSYGLGSANSDPYYQENLVIGDLPAGDYVVWLPYDDTMYDAEIQIFPGMVNYFSFRGKNGIETEPPDALDSEFVPPDTTLTPTP